MSLSLSKEIDETLPPDAKQNPADDTSKLAEMPLLNAIISSNEALRLQPPVPTGLQRAPKSGGGGKMVGSVFVPEGTALYLPPYVIHRDARYFSPNPDRFWPDRWLENPDCNPPTSKTDRSAFIPYSVGPMNCAGKLVAQLELRLVVATLVQKLDMSLAPTSLGPHTVGRRTAGLFRLQEGCSSGCCEAKGPVETVKFSVVRKIWCSTSK
ncbi:cytochrome P450 [Mycena galericulata]|nr:cytochrome P450 [Mycena galericulata]